VSNFDIFSVYNSESFPILIGNKLFYVTVLLLISFGDQFVVSDSEIRHSRRHWTHCSVSLCLSSCQSI